MANKKNYASKLEELADQWGMDVDTMVEDAVFDSAVASICVNEGCDYSTEMEPDQEHGWCEECSTGTVVSCLILAGIM